MSVSFYATKSEVDAPRFEYIRGLDGPNWANGNARFLLPILGLPYDPETGELEGRVSIAEARRAAIRARNAGDRRVASNVRPTVEYGGPGTGTCRVVECGIDEAGIRYRLDAFAEFVGKAVAAGARAIYWA
jgi:hypothetical protein